MLLCSSALACGSLANFSRYIYSSSSHSPFPPLHHQHPYKQLSRLEGYAHVDLAGKAMDRNALQRDLGSIISCMKLLQVGLFGPAFRIGDGYFYRLALIHPTHTRTDGRPEQRQ